MLTVMLNNNRQYAVGKVVAGKYESLQWWTVSSFINAGSGPVNTINVSYDTVLERFTLKINGGSALIFTDDEEPKHSGGDNGYIAVISPLDRFDQGEAVDVYFQRVK
jgi:hypothetical protein